MKPIPLQPRLHAIFANHGEAKIRATIRKFYDLMLTDVLIGFFFTGKNLDEIAERQGDFILRAMGARESYAGKSPADAHEELPPILKGHFDRRLKLLGEFLAKEGFAPDEVHAWVQFERSFEPRIVASTP